MKAKPIPSLSRRYFISKAVAGSALLLATPLLSEAHSYLPVDNKVTVGQIMDLFIGEVPGAPFEGTVDTLKSGSRDIVVTGIVTTMFATIDVIRKAIALNANFIIAHEPTFYNHRDETNWLEADDVYHYKVDLLKQHNIAVWRNHDYIHSLKTDGVKKALSEQLGWQKFADIDERDIYNLAPALTLKALIAHAKARLNIAEVRYIGNPEQVCKKVLLFPGAAGGTRQITAIIKTKPDVMMCGEISEWETAEYVRDARAKGKSLCLIVLGHSASEEPGAEFMLKWIKDKYPAITVTHIPSGSALSFM
ncbi:Nif3-like dinuclear metal center hexameric protein [Mucilaginibacter agri]|uniref:NGG1p interacting factor NIF3 n=1 Tax=Mucilaginibacter agri TaxID=2695265 RepID=A0A966DSV3_9SPHI|nr:Nif3-like dinuclear metal center hexameric protein [Mucilaginibacter agri]NCD68726.1 NGG1p interacting factor NIF3 [Mucilaginibacter agri]